MTTPTGTIHDLGYKRYVGTRRPTSTRWRVIMRNQIATAWQRWWRYKLALFFVVVITFIAGALMYFWSSKVIRGFGSGVNEIAMTFVDIALPGSIGFYCSFGGFVLSLSLGAMIVASDTQSGAFTFYYVRPVRPLDYVLGKLAGYGFLVATLLLIPPFALAAFRLGMSDNVDQLIGNLIILPKTLAIGALATLVYTTVPLAISSLMGNRRYALALWAAYYLIIGNIFVAVSYVAAWPDIAGLHMPTAVKAITYDWFDVRILRGAGPKLPATTALWLLLGQAGVAIGVLWYQVSRGHRIGVGGSS